MFRFYGLRFYVLCWFRLYVGFFYVSVPFDSPPANVSLNVDLHAVESVLISGSPRRPQDASESPGCASKRQETFPKMTQEIPGRFSESLRRPQERPSRRQEPQGGPPRIHGFAHAQARQAEKNLGGSLNQLKYETNQMNIYVFGGLGQA